jgi:dTMP kinase
MKQIPKFITIEGIDGSGKSTFIPKVEKMLRDRGENIILTREPGGPAVAEEIRDLLLNRKMDKTTELLLAFAARNENIKDIIEPALEKGNFVLCDRFTDSTYAYQVSAGGVPIEYAEVLEHMVQKGLKPGLTIIFSVPTEVSRERLNKTGKTPDKFESQDAIYFQKAIEGYEDAARRDPERCKIVDSSRGIEHTETQVIKIMEEFFAKLDLQEKNKPENKKNKM